jgi:sugar phosphate isomerase/epimerase
MLRLCVSTLGCPDWTLDQVIDRCAEYGLDGIDFRGIGRTIDITQLDEFTTGVDKTVARLRERNLGVPCLCSSITLNQPDPRRWQASLDEFARSHAVAEALGSWMIRIFPGQSPKDLSRDETIALARRHIRQLLKLSEGRRARPVLETHDDWNTGAAISELLSDVAPADFPVIWDMRHSLRAGESIHQTLSLMGPRIGHVHIKDSVLADGKEHPRIPGQGDLPLAEAIAALRRFGYEGWWCLESEKRWQRAEAPEPEVIFPGYVQFMKGVLA